MDPPFVIHRPPALVVIPAKAGIQGGRAASFVTLDPRLRGDDGVEGARMGMKKKGRRFRGAPCQDQKVAQSSLEAAATGLGEASGLTGET